MPTLAYIFGPFDTGQSCSWPCFPPGPDSQRTEQFQENIRQQATVWCRWSLAIMPEAKDGPKSWYRGTSSGFSTAPKTNNGWRGRSTDEQNRDNNSWCSKEEQKKETTIKRSMPQTEKSGREKFPPSSSSSQILNNKKTALFTFPRLRQRFGL